MKRLISSCIAAVILVGGGALAANADDVKPPIATPATTCMNCK